MRTRVTIDDDLIAKASQLTGVTDTATLLRDALTTMVRVESARRLAALGGTDPKACAADRRTRGCLDAGPERE